MSSKHYTTQHHNGRLYETCLSFITEKEVNDFLEKNDDYGLLYEFPIKTVALKSEKGKKYVNTFLNMFKRHAQTWSDDNIHNNELSLYFDNEEDFKRTYKQLMTTTLAECIRAFKSPKDSPKQLQYTIFIERPLSDHFTQKPQAIATEKLLKSIGIDTLHVGYFGAGRCVMKTRTYWTLENIKARLKEYGIENKLTVEEHPLTNLAAHYFEVR